MMMTDGLRWWWWLPMLMMTTIPMMMMMICYDDAVFLVFIWCKCWFSYDDDDFICWWWLPMTMMISYDNIYDYNWYPMMFCLRWWWFAMMMMMVSYDDDYVEILCCWWWWLPTMTILISYDDDDFLCCFYILLMISYADDCIWWLAYDADDLHTIMMCSCDDFLWWCWYPMIMPYDDNSVLLWFPMMMVMMVMLVSYDGDDGFLCLDIKLPNMMRMMMTNVDEDHNDPLWRFPMMMISHDYEFLW